MREDKGIYVASRASVRARGEMWRRYRALGFPIISTWIDEDGPGQSASLAALWARIGREVAESGVVVLYAEPGDFPLKGALVEIGIAIGAGVPIILCLPGVELEERTLRPLGSWAQHELVVARIDDVGQALRRAAEGLACV